MIDGSEARRLSVRSRVVRAAFRIPLPGVRARQLRRHRDRTAAGHRALVRAGRGAGAGGTARYVDSSVERLQVRVRGLDRRTLLPSPATAGALPLQSTGTQGEFVCGVRYRAWQPPRCLHPTIPVHTPLVFDVVDLSARPLHRRLHVSRGASRRAELRDLSGKLERGRGAAQGAVLRVRPHAGSDARFRRSKRIRSFRSTLDLRRAAATLAHTRAARAARPAGREGDIHNAADNRRHPGCGVTCRSRGPLGRSAAAVRAFRAATGASSPVAIGADGLPDSSAAAGRPASSSSRPTASPTTSTAIRRARNGPGRWIRFRW